MELNEGQVILADKPLEWTSFDVVKKLRYHLKVKKIGHAGTLDPLATGLLILCSGKKTKEIQHFQELHKEYSGQMILGKVSPSYDLELPFEEENDISDVNLHNIKACADGLTGEIDQIPPSYSAIKVDGKRSYDIARDGKMIELKKRRVTIHEFQITSFEKGYVSFSVKCSKGTYIRSLVRDMGECLSCGATLTQLTRTAIGNYKLNNAHSVDDFISLIKGDS